MFTVTVAFIGSFMGGVLVALTMKRGHRGPPGPKGPMGPPGNDYRSIRGHGVCLCGSGTAFCPVHNPP